MTNFKAWLPALLSAALFVAAMLLLPTPDATGQSNVTSFNTVQLDGLLRLSPQAATVTTTFIITPTRSNIVLSSTGAATSSTSTPIITTSARAGDLLIIRNSNASAALVVDGTGGTVECGANISLGAQDSMTVIYDASGQVWRCVAVRDN